MELVVRHQTTYRYATEAAHVAMLLRLVPSRLDGQVPRQWEVTVNGAPVRSFAANAYGDQEGFFQHRSPLAEVVVVAAGVVETRDQAGVVSGFARELPLPVFLRQTPLTRPDPAIAGLAGACPGGDPLTRLHALVPLVRAGIGYLPGSTSSASTAAEALAQGRGVCQDQAHLFVSAARVMGIPARYVTGYLLSPEAGQDASETHAWAEAWVPGLGWVGFDATNGICVTDHYVRLCCGLDAREAAPVAGSVYGASGIGIHADVRISAAHASEHEQIGQQQQQ